MTRDALALKEAELDARRQQNGDFEQRAHRHECDLLKQKRRGAAALLRTVLSKTRRARRSRSSRRKRIRNNGEE